MKRGTSTTSNNTSTKRCCTTLDVSQPLPLLPKDVQFKILDYLVWNNPYNTPVWRLCQEVYAYFVKRRHAYRARICLLHSLDMYKVTSFRYIFTAGERIINDYCASSTHSYRLYTICQENNASASFAMFFCIDKLHHYLPHVPLHVISDDLAYRCGKCTLDLYVFSHNHSHKICRFCKNQCIFGTCINSGTYGYTLRSYASNSNKNTIDGNLS